MQVSPFHEDFGRATRPAHSSNRAFGIVVGLVIVVLSLKVKRLGSSPRYVFLSAGVAVLLAAGFAPRVLSPLNRAWTRLAVLISRVTNPLLMGIVFLVAVTPLALLLRLIRKTPLSSGPRSLRTTYWHKREEQTSMQHPF